ncbi:MAG: DUF3990 domain-containing protein [Roseburia sp.]|nr:DUF3990 domain-containing protein [Roseburia sp.]
MKINTVKTLYHGTDRAFRSFDFGKAKPFKDFGKGFYLTSNFKQAQKWAQRRAETTRIAYIYRYELAPVDQSDWKILELLQYDRQWVDFISKSRIEGSETEYDIIYDRIADNQYAEISDALREYAAYRATAEEVISRIRWDTPGADQYCFKNKRALTLLRNRVTIIQQMDSDGRWMTVAR